MGSACHWQPVACTWKMALIMSRALCARGLLARLPVGKRFCIPLFIGHVTWIHDDSLLQILSLRKAKSCWTRLSTGSQCAAATVQNASYSPNSLRGTVFLQALFLSKSITIFLIVMTECVSSPEIAICPSVACCPRATIACHVSHDSHPADLGAHFSHTAHRRCVLSAAAGSCM